MKRLTLLLVAVALLWPAAANAQLTMQMSNGWSFTFAGNVNVFWVFTKQNTAAGDAANSSIRTGLLPTFATFEARGKEAGMNLGRIGYGYIYPNFNAQVTYSTKGGTPAQISIGLFQPSTLGSGTYTFTSIPRVEAEVTYNKKSGSTKYMVWAGGLWQTTKNAPTGGRPAGSFGGTRGGRW